MSLRKKIKKFLKGKEKKLVIEYKPKRLTVAAEWYKFRNPLGMMWRGFWFQVIFCKLPPSRIKNFLYGLFGVKIGKDVVIADDVYIDPLFPELITIEDGAILGTHCVVPAHGISRNKLWLGRTTIKKFAVIGAYAYLKAGVVVGENSVVGNLSLVTEDVKDNTVVANPKAKEIRRLR